LTKIYDYSDIFVPVGEQPKIDHDFNNSAALILITHVINRIEVPMRISVAIKSSISHHAVISHKQLLLLNLVP
jgi:hypothetical protein